MPYITSWERRGEKRGEKQGLLKAVTLVLKRKFGRLDANVRERLGELSVARLEQLAVAAIDFAQPDELDRWLRRRAN